MVEATFRFRGNVWMAVPLPVVRIVAVTGVSSWDWLRLPRLFALTINGSGVPPIPLVTMEPPPVLLFGVLQLLPPEELLPPLLLCPLMVVVALRLSPFGSPDALPNLSGDGVLLLLLLLCVSEPMTTPPLVVRDSGIGMLPPAGELEFRFTADDGGLARLGDDAAISTGEMVVWSGRLPMEAVVATLDRELDELYRMPLRPGAMPGGSFSKSRSDCTLLAVALLLLFGMASVSGARREKSTSPHWDSSRFSTSIRFWEEIFSFASRSISCSYSRSLRFNT